MLLCLSIILIKYSFLVASQIMNYFMRLQRIKIILMNKSRGKLFIERLKGKGDKKWLPIMHLSDLCFLLSSSRWEIYICFFIENSLKVYILHYMFLSPHKNSNEKMINLNIYINRFFLLKLKNSTWDMNDLWNHMIFYLSSSPPIIFCGLVVVMLKLWYLIMFFFFFLKNMLNWTS